MPQALAGSRTDLNADQGFSRSHVPRRKAAVLSRNRTEDTPQALADADPLDESVQNRTEVRKQLEEIANSRKANEDARKAILPRALPRDAEQASAVLLAVFKAL